MPVRRNYKNVYQDGKRRLEQNSPITNFNTTGIARSFIDMQAVEMEKLYNSADYIYRAIDPTRNLGSDLDKTGFLVGESRTSAVTASDPTDTNFNFYIDPRLSWSLNTLITKNYNANERDTLEDNGYIIRSDGLVTSLIIPAGTIVQNSDGSITYTTNTNSTIDSTGSAFVGIIATSVGPSFNVQTNNLIAHRILEIPELRKIANFIKCTNRFPISGGKYSLTDEEFRYNIATSKAALRTNELRIRRAALSVPGVRDIMYEKNKYGYGTVNITLDGISPLISQGLIEAVSQRVQQETSFGDTIFVNRPEYLGVSLNFNIIVSPGITDVTTIRRQARDAVVQYINDLPLGGEIIWNEIVSIVLNIDEVIDFIPNYFKIGEYDIFNKINKKEIVLRFFNQKADMIQKWYTDIGLCSVCA